MKNAWIGILSLGLAGLVAVTGCNTKTDDSGAHASSDNGSGGGHVGTVDLDKVATDIGWMNQMQANLSSVQNQLKVYEEDVKKSFTDQLNNKMKELGIKDGEKVEEAKKHGVTDEQLQQLAGMANTANQNLQIVDRQLVQVLQKYQADWAAQYRTALGPIIRQVAQDKKVTVVLASGGQLLYTDPAVNITDAVVDAAKKSPPTLSPVPLPVLNAVPGINVGPAGATTKPTTKP